jgi:hypothetical protein
LVAAPIVLATVIGVFFLKNTIQSIVPATAAIHGTIQTY